MSKVAICRTVLPRVGMLSCSLGCMHSSSSSLCYPLCDCYANVLRSGAYDCGKNAPPSSDEPRLLILPGGDADAVRQQRRLGVGLSAMFASAVQQAAHDAFQVAEAGAHPATSKRTPTDRGRQLPIAQDACKFASRLHPQNARLFPEDHQGIYRA